MHPNTNPEIAHITAPIIIIGIQKGLSTVRIVCSVRLDISQCKINSNIPTKKSITAVRWIEEFASTDVMTFGV